MNSSDQTYQLLARLLTALEANGYPIGTGKHLQVQELLRQIPPGTPPQQLKTYLAPIFTQSPEEQAQFYELFDRSLKAVQAQSTDFKPEQPSEAEKAVNTWRRLVYTLATIVGILVLLLALPYLFDKTAKPTQETITPPSIATQDTFFYDIKIPDNDTAKILEASLDSGQVVAINEFGSYTVDSTGRFFFFADTIAGEVAPINVELMHHQGKHIAQFLLTIEAPPAPTPTTPPQQTKASSITFLDQKSLPYPSNLDELRINPDQQFWAELDRKYGWLVKIGVIALLGLLLYAIVQWREKRRQHIITELEEHAKAPYIWRLPLKPKIAIPFSEDFQQTLNQFRQRVKSDHLTLNVPQTVQATIRKGGMADFRFKAQTKPPEYLLLIDRQYLDNHRARVYDLLYKNFKANEVLVERFFYDNDPRLCYNEKYQKGLRLQDLQHRYGQHRLLILSDGFSMLSPISGKLAKWTNLFSVWKNRALLTHIPPSNWGNRERFLAEQFAILPASLQGLRAAVDFFETDEPINVRRAVQDAPIAAIQLENGLIETLHQHFSEKDENGNIIDDRLVQWIAACAVYPTVQWELTLEIGQVVDEELVTFENLLQLARLPWFVEGRIPDAARGILLDYLPQNVEVKVRTHLQQLFQALPKPPVESAAAEDYTVTQLTNTLHLTPNDRTAEQDLAYYLAAGVEPDLTTIRYLDRPKNRLDFIVPDALKKYAFHDGRPFFGWRAVAWALPLWLLLSGFVAFFDPNFEACEGEIVQFGELQLCLDSQEDWLRYYDHLSRRLLQQQQHDRIDAVNEQVDSIAYVLSPEATDSLIESLNIPQQNQQQQAPVGTSRNALLQAKSDLLQELRTPQVSDLETSLYEKYYHNLATAYYNSGVLMYNLYKEKLNQLNEEFGESIYRQLVYPVTEAQQNMEEEVLALRDSSCYLFDRAYQFYKKDVDLLDLALWCNATENIFSPDIPASIRGNIRDAESREVVENVQVFNKKLGTTETNSDGEFYFPQPDIPLTTFRLQFTKAGYDTTSVLATSDNPTNILLTPEPGREPTTSSPSGTRNEDDAIVPQTSEQQNAQSSDSENNLAIARQLLNEAIKLINNREYTRAYERLQTALTTSEGSLSEEINSWKRRLLQLALSETQFQEIKRNILEFTNTGECNKAEEALTGTPILREDPEISKALANCTPSNIPDDIPTQYEDFTDHTVTLTVEAVNLPEGASKVQLTPSTIDVVLRVPLDLLKEFNPSSEVSAIVDFQNIETQAGKRPTAPEIEVNVVCSNRAVRVVSHTPRRVQYYLIK